MDPFLPLRFQANFKCPFIRKQTCFALTIVLWKREREVLWRNISRREENGRMEHFQTFTPQIEMFLSDRKCDVMEDLDSDVLTSGRNLSFSSLSCLPMNN